MTRLGILGLVLLLGCPAAWAQDSAGKDATPFKAPFPAGDTPVPDTVTSINPLRDVTPLALAPSRPERPRFIAWASAEYILGAMSRSGVPALVTTSPSGTAQADAGVINRPGTTMLLGPGSFGAAISSGAQFGFGIRVVEDVDVEVSGLFLVNAPTRFHASSSDTAIIARPFFEPITGQEASLLVAYPGRFDGSIDISTRTTLWGIDANVFERFDLGIPLTLGIGVRYLNLTDNLQFQQNTTALGAPALTFNGAAIPLSDSVQILDSFHTNSEFIGPQLALKYGESIGRWSFDFYGKLALGSTARTVVVTGQSNHVSSSGQVVDIANGGFLATPTNMGNFVGSTLGVVPEINLKVGYQLRSNVKLFVAYDFLCWTNVARANDQVDHAVNLTQVPTAAVFNPAFGGPSSPAQLFRSSDLTVHSFRAGLEWRF